MPGKRKGGWFFHFPSSREMKSRILFFLVVLSVLITGAICFRNAVRWVGKPFAGFLVQRRMTVPSLGLPYWTGFQVGLRPADKIVKANQGNVSSVEELDRAVKSIAVGESIRYTVKRGGQFHEIAVPTMRFSVNDFLMTFGIDFFQGLVYLGIGVIVFLLKPDTPVSWVFLLATASQGTSSLINFEVCSGPTRFSYVLIFSESLISALVIHFSAIFPLSIGFFEKRRKALLLPYIVSALLFVAMAGMYPGPSFIRYYPAAYVYGYIAIFSMLASLSYSYLKNISALARQRARVIFWGAMISFPLPMTAAVILNFGIHSAGLRTFTNFTALPVLIFPVVIGYSITRHNLFDVDVYVKRAVGYGLMTIVVGAGYFALQVILKDLVLAPLLGDLADRAYPVLFSFLIVFLFNPVSRRLQEGVDRIFFRKKFDYKEAVISVSDALSSVLRLDEVVHRIIDAIRKEMFVDNSGVIVLDPRKEASRGFFVADGSGPGSDSVTDTFIPDSDPLVSLVTGEKRLITKYDIAEDPRYASLRKDCASRFADLGASLAIPMVYQGKVNAVITVGHKKSGHFFSKEDIELLKTLASHGSVAIENAHLAEQMKKEETVRTNLSRYLSPQIVDRIVKHDVQVNLGGDRKVVTILFSDIRNFTTITESRPPDQLIAILNEYFTSMAETIFEQQGSLDKYIGDAIVAVFGSLVPVENPARNAVAAAIAMMNRLPELNRRWEERYGFSMNIGIGVNTGEVFLGNIGSPERMEFTVIGDAVNVASRFSGLAKPGQVLVTRETLNHLGTDFPVREHPPAEVKGKAGKLEVFEILYAQSST